MAATDTGSVDQKVRTAIRAKDYYGAYDLLARTYLDTVYRYCFRVLREDIDRAKDLTQQVFEEVCSSIARFRGDASAKTWLLAIAPLAAGAGMAPTRTIQ